MNRNKEAQNTSVHCAGPIIATVVPKPWQRCLILRPPLCVQPLQFLAQMSAEMAAVTVQRARDHTHSLTPTHSLSLSSSTQKHQNGVMNETLQDLNLTVYKILTLINAHYTANRKTVCTFMHDTVTVTAACGRVKTRWYIPFSIQVSCL